MWNPIYIKIRNLFAHKDSEYRFKNNVCTVIFGKNNTDRNFGNNGAGKTTLLEGIAIALTNESLRDVKKDNFINRDEDDCMVDFLLENYVLKKSLRIVRRFFRGNKPVKIEIYENDVLNTQLTSVLEANKYIFEQIGITREDLLRYFIISQDNRYMFFTASDGDKKEIMNRITSADMINPVLETLAERLKEKEAEYKPLADEADEITVRIELLSEQAEELEKMNTFEDDLRAIQDRRAEIKSEAGEKAVLVKKYTSLIKEKEVQIQAISVPTDAQTVKDKVKRLKREIEGLEDTLLEDRTIERKLKLELSEAITCPKCKHKFLNQSELGLTVRETKMLLAESEENVLAGQKSIKIKKQALEKATAKLREVERAQEILDGLEEEKALYKRKLKRQEEEIKECTERLKKLDRQEEEIKERKKSNVQLKAIQDKIARAKEQLEAIEPRMKSIKEDLDMIRFWNFSMGKSGFSTYLANKSIKIIEGITNSFLRKFDVDLSVLINGFTVLKSGEVREKIDVFVETDGTDAETFRAKSGGERGRVNLAGVLGIQHLINLSTNGRGLNLICLDECFNGIDSEGQENIIKVLEKVGVTILMITQNVSDSFNNKNKLYVVKENKVARYVDSLQS